MRVKDKHVRATGCAIHLILEHTWEWMMDGPTDGRTDRDPLLQKRRKWRKKKKEKKKTRVEGRGVIRDTTWIKKKKNFAKKS